MLHHQRRHCWHDCKLCSCRTGCEQCQPQELCLSTEDSYSSQWQEGPDHKYSLVELPVRWSQSLLMKLMIWWQDIVSSTVGYLEPFSFEVILIEHESDDQPTVSEGFQVDVLYQMSLLEPAIQHQPEGDTTVCSILLVWLKTLKKKSSLKGNKKTVHKWDE